MLNEKRDKILFIDDEHSSHIIMNLIIPSFSSCILLTSENANHGLDLARKHANEIAIVFCDVLLPDIDGYDIHGYLEEILDFNEVKFCFQSGLNDTEIKKGFLNHQDIEIISKPYKHDTIKDVVSNNIHSKFIL